MDHLSAAKQVVHILAKAGFTAYFAGGWVRDFLLNHPSDDIDIVSSASTKQIQELFPHTIPVGIAFGIVIVVHEHHHFEVATFRQESGYLDGRRPTSISSSSPQEDAQRRDFTINGMFWDPIEEKLYDFVKGQEDLQAKVIRAIGDPDERFLEDRLRMMRAVRYATRFGFKIARDTELAIMAHAHNLLPSVAIERIWQEFKKMSHFDRFDQGLIELHRLKLLPVIFPQLQGVSSEEIQERIASTRDLPIDTPPIAELIELFPHETISSIIELCDYLKLSREDRELALFLHQTRELFAMPEDWQSRLEDIEWVKWYSHPHATLGLTWAASHIPFSKREEFIKVHEHRQEKLSNFIQRAKNKNPVVRSEHLKQAGIKPSKQMGELLIEAEKLSIQLKLENPEAVIAILKKSPLWDTACL